MSYFEFIISEDSFQAKSGRAEKLRPWQSVWKQRKAGTENGWSRNKARTQL